MEMVLFTKNNPLIINYLLFYYYILLTCIVLVHSQTVFIPELPEFVKKTTTSMKGPIVNLLSVDNPLQIQYSIQSMPIKENVTLTNVNYCVENLLNNNHSLCLFEFSYDILINIENNFTTLPYVTRSFTQLKPVLMIQCLKNNCSTQLDSSFLHGMYFVYAFHTSIWSLILLYTLTTGSLLFLFEYSRPSCKKYTKISPPTGPSLNLWDSYIYVFMALFLQSSYKLPKSWGGIAITLFWHAFCLICIIAYVMGTSELIFEQYTNDELKYRPYLNSQNETIYCNLHPKVCKYFEKKFSYPMEILNGKILASEINTSMILLTDHIHGQYLKSGKHRKNGWNYVKLACNTEDVEEDDDNGRVKANERFQDMPLTEMGFLTFNQKSLWGMNAYLKYLEESGKIYNIHLHKEKVFDFATKTQVYETLCITNEDQNIPIRLKQMNGPLLFMIIGGFSAIITHISEHIYYIVMNR
uniref:Thyroid receptor-interacting protein 11 n=1 Tax=Schistosoma japonicum TaxID=6182 RepID=C1L3N0_SCHJA|nr:Thyroid receptor-interacting protein 11 [Schistosoma japonicum]